jgi:peptidoglycan/LPS O-acetylase OafA/YrhL
MDSAAGQAPRATELDGIRGWASLSVLVFHLVFIVFGDRFIELRAHRWAFAP